MFLNTTEDGSARVRAPGELRPLGSQAIQGGHVLLLHGLGEWRRDGRRRDERRDVAMLVRKADNEISCKQRISGLPKIRAPRPSIQSRPSACSQGAARRLIIRLAARGTTGRRLNACAPRREPTAPSQLCGRIFPGARAGALDESRGARAHPRASLGPITKISKSLAGVTHY